MAAPCGNQCVFGSDVNSLSSGMSSDDEDLKPSIKFVNDDQVINILQKNAQQCGKEENMDPVDEETKHEVHNLLKARILASEVGSGQAIFGFKTPKRKDALAYAAQSAKKSSKKSKSNISKGRTPKPDDREACSSKQIGSKLSRRKPLYVEEVSNSDEEESEEEGESEDEEVSASSSQKNGNGLKSNDDILDEYFEIHSSKYKPATSDKTLAKLQNPKLQQQELVNHLKEVQATHIVETACLIRSHSCHFQRWMFQLLNGFNVLLYGLGSKHKLLEEFRKRYFKDEVNLVINGFFPSITIKQILNTICEDVLNDRSSFRHITDQANYIKAEYNRDNKEKLFLIVHNIDGQMLRSKNSQVALACLASSKNIHVVASIDHINAPLIWDQNLSSSYNWLWYDCTTYEPYAEETSYENSLMVQQSGTLALSSLVHVLRSLTPNAKGIFRLLVDCQLDNEDNSSYIGLSFSDLYNRCRERFLVNSDLTLRAQLTEFKDHKLIKTKKAPNGLEYLSVAVDCSTLRLYLEENEE